MTEEQNTKRCPYCGEIIKSTAMKCKFCGEWLVKKENNNNNIYDAQVTEETQNTGWTIAVIVIIFIIGCFLYGGSPESKLIGGCSNDGERSTYNFSGFFA